MRIRSTNRMLDARLLNVTGRNQCRRDVAQVLHETGKVVCFLQGFAPQFDYSPIQSSAPVLCANRHRTFAEHTLSESVCARHECAQGKPLPSLPAAANGPGVRLGRRDSGCLPSIMQHLPAGPARQAAGEDTRRHACGCICRTSARPVVAACNRGVRATSPVARSQRRARDGRLNVSARQFGMPDTFPRLSLSAAQHRNCGMSVARRNLDGRAQSGDYDAGCFG